MRNVHYYFLKLFGCLILEGDIPIDIAPFSDGILQEKPHANVYLAFGPAPDLPVDKMAGGSDVEVALLNGQCAFATWFHSVGPLWINVMYARDGERRRGLARAWHPRLGYKSLTLVNFAPDATGEESD